MKVSFPLIFKKPHSISTIITLLIVFGLGCYIGEMKEEWEMRVFIESFKTVRAGNSSSSYINPILGTVSSPATDVGLYSDLKSDIVSFINNEKRKGNLEEISFYFRDLNSLFWFGVEEDANFIPASLLKVPLAIAVYKEAESEAGFLDRHLIYTKEMDVLNDSIPGNEDSSLSIGKSYSVKELVGIMLEYSDNGAKDLLGTVVKKESIEAIFKAAALGDPFADLNYKVSSKKYSQFLRVLYNASYLNEEHSSYLLSVLSKSNFVEGLVAKIPQEVNVAHKYGVYEKKEVIRGNAKNITVLNDCGIVYHLGHPYVICVMVKGGDLRSLARIISEISALVFIYQDTHDHDDFDYPISR